QELQAEADTEKRLARTDVAFQRFYHAGLTQPLDRVAEGTDTWKDNFGGFSDPVGIAADIRTVANLFERLLYATKVTHTVVDNNDRLHARFLCESNSSIRTPWLRAKRRPADHNFSALRCPFKWSFALQRCCLRRERQP